MGANTEAFSAPADNSLALKPVPWSVHPAAAFAAESLTRSRGATPLVEAPPKFTVVRAVLFDVDNVLYDASSWRRWLTQILGKFSPRTLETDFLQSWTEIFLPAAHRGQQEFHVALACCLKQLGLASSLVDEIVAASRAQRRRDQNNLRPFPAVRDTLVRLQTAGIRRAVFANTDRSGQLLRNQLERLSLASLFDQILSSAESCASLADQAAYELAIEKLGCPGGEILFVGHVARDLHAAHAAGLQTLGFNVRQECRAIRSIDRFEELLSVALTTQVAIPSAALPPPPTSSSAPRGVAAPVA